MSEEKTQEENTLKNIEKRSAYNIKSIYDIKLLTRKREHLLDLKVEEDLEDLLLTYDIREKTEFSSLISRDRQEKLKVLRAIPKLFNLSNEYAFSLDPANIYIDDNLNPYIKRRDLYKNGEIKDRSEDILNEYKALCGYLLGSSKRSYDDYLKAGDGLFNKNKLLKSIKSAKTSDEIRELLRNEIEKTDKDRKENKTYADKKLINLLKLSSIAFGIAGLILGAYLLYMLLKVKPYDEAVIKAWNEYIENDYLGVWTALEDIDVEDMDIHLKYILAVSTIKTESLTDAQRANILNTISLTSGEKRLEYWIYLGRGDVMKAEDLAMQMSDDELLLYAYMTEESLIELSDELTGEEKNEKITELNEKMSSLLESYENLDDEKTLDLSGTDEDEATVTTDDEDKMSYEDDESSSDMEEITGSSSITTSIDNNSNNNSSYSNSYGYENSTTSKASENSARSSSSTSISSSSDDTEYVYIEVEDTGDDNEENSLNTSDSDDMEYSDDEDDMTYAYIEVDESTSTHNGFEIVD